MKKKLLTMIAATVFGTSLYSTSAMAMNIKVKSGDSLYKLSKKYNVPVTKLKTDNKLKSDRILVGQNLYIYEKGKVAAKKSTSPSTLIYTVKKGDALSLIAKKYGMTVTQLKSLNGLKTSLIRQGQKLKVRGKITTPSIKAPKNTSTPKIVVSTFNKSKLIKDAKAVIGTPYKWGGTTPSGFDCSGFIYYVIKKQKSIPRETVGGYWNRMKPVTTLSVGDFVYYETYKPGPSHMGIYVENGKFIHSSSSRGVQISDMKNSYWKSRYLGARQL
ncbi:NlpC/P60 family protein [Neobacillus drentensis]|uniref:NlpC/P60 family protein n=1 Tax=Neobacillus drentensis TaxID=220684 RepID=UPI0030008320